MKQVPYSHEVTDNGRSSVNCLYGNHSNHQGHSCDLHNLAASSILMILQKLLVSPTFHQEYREC